MKTAKRGIQLKYVMALSILATVLSVAALAHTTLSTMALTDDNATTFKIRQYQYLKIKFCYERDIKPCTSQELSTWNKAHTDDIFNLNLSSY